MNYWHEIDAGSPDEINTIIEIPKYSKNKYEIDKDTGLIALDRAMHTAQDYPFDYGFIPQTLWDDGDAVDVIVLTTYPLDPAILVRTRPIGVMEMIDDGESDDKLIGVPVDDPRFSGVKDIADVNEHKKKEIRHFFESYKGLQDAEVEVREFKGKEEAIDCFKRGQELYKNEFSE